MHFIHHPAPLFLANLAGGPFQSKVLGGCQHGVLGDLTFVGRPISYMILCTSIGEYMKERTVDTEVGVSDNLRIQTELVDSR